MAKRNRSKKQEELTDPTPPTKRKFEMVSLTVRTGNVKAKIDKANEGMHEVFKKNVKMLRVKRDLTQEEAAARIEITRERWSEVETGRNRPSFEKIIVTALALNVTPMELLDPTLADRLEKEGFRDTYHVK